MIELIPFVKEPIHLDEITMRNILSQINHLKKASENMKFSENFREKKIEALFEVELLLIKLGYNFKEQPEA